MSLSVPAFIKELQKLTWGDLALERESINLKEDLEFLERKLDIISLFHSPLKIKLAERLERGNVQP